MRLANTVLWHPVAGSDHTSTRTRAHCLAGITGEQPNIHPLKVIKLTAWVGEVNVGD